MTTRRDAMKIALRSGAYAAPAILAVGTVPVGVAAVSPPGSTFTASVIQRPTAGTCDRTTLFPVLELDVTVALHGALPNASLVLYLDTTLATGGVERIHVTPDILTDASGNASFTARLTFIAAGFTVVGGVAQGFPTAIVANVSQPGQIGNPLYSTRASLTNQQCP